MFLKVKVYSKSNLQLIKFFTLIKKTKKLLPNLVFKQLEPKKRKKFVSVLKSPHVNKTAQKQFEFSICYYTFKILPIRNLISLLLIKKLKSFNSLGLKVEVNGKLGLTLNDSFYLNFLNPNKINLKFINHDNPKLLYTNKCYVKNYFKTFDLFGELILKNAYLNKIKSCNIFSSDG